jgi:thioredoxin-related protein
MSFNRKFFVLFLTLIFAAGMVSAKDIIYDGVQPGKWTMDYDAALKYAKKNKLPVFLKFTGSDWCVWCKLMEKSVFGVDKWLEYAKNKIVLVTLDYPKNAEIVPAKYRERNKKLQAEYGIRGYPTYIILDYDGKTRLGQLGAGKEKTVDSFIAEVNDVLRNSSAALDKFIAKLPADQEKKYREYLAEYRAVKDEMENWLKSQPENTPGNMEKYSGFQSKMDELHYKMREIEVEFFASKMNGEDAHAYRIANAKYQGAIAEFNAWLDTRPQRTPENTEIYNGYQNKVKVLMAEINKYEEPLR